MTKLARDAGSVYVLEAIILALILLGAAYSITTLQTTSVPNDRPRAHLESVARDSMTILGGLEDANGSLLDAYLVEALHCARDALPSDLACDGVRSANLSLKIESYLPPGAGYAIAIDNGVNAHDIYRSTLPPGETVSATHTFSPRWNLTFLASDLSCYEPGMDARFTALPLRRGGHGALDSLAILAPDGARAEAAPVEGTPFWAATFPGAELGGAGVFTADADARLDTYSGAVHVDACDMGGIGPLLVDTLRQSATLNVDPPVAALGARVTFEADLRPLLEAADLTLLASNVTIYDPLPGRGGDPDTYLPAAVLDLDAATHGEGTWDVPPDARYGIHPVVLKARFKTPTGVEVEVRRIDTVTVAIPDGTVPIDPPYRFVLQVWLSDWR